MSNYADTIAGNINKKLGEIPSVFDFGASGSTVSTTTVGTTTSGATTVHLSSPSSFVNGNGIVIAGAGASGANYVGTITDVTGSIATITPATSTTVSSGAAVNHDDSGAFNTAIGQVSSTGGTGGGTLLVPGGYTYQIWKPILITSSMSNVTIIGDGQASIVKRMADMLDGSGNPVVGLFDIAGVNITLSDLLIEGNVTTSVGVNYSTLAASTPLAYDPMQTVMSKNSSIWVHGGASSIKVEGLTIQHTGGYALLIDGASSDVKDVQVLNSMFLNNRPHLFGFDPTDLNYGSWSGGIYYNGDCRSGHSLTSVKGLLVDGCTFRRGTGNQVWGHAWGYDTTHTNLRVTNCHFEDIGRDCVEPLITSGVVVSNNTARRIGYICTNDTSASTPKYLIGSTAPQGAVFIDGGAINFEYTNNSAISVNGGFFDLDSCFYGVLDGNICRMPQSGDPEYSEDSIASLGYSYWSGSSTSFVAGQVTYGAQPSANFNALGGTNISFLNNTFINCAGGALRLVSARGCHISNNTINHPSGASYPPILLQNGSYHTYDNSIVGNNIQWSPGSSSAAVQESNSGGSWSSGEKNWVADNRIFGNGNAYEFQKDSTSSSTTGTVISSQYDGGGSGLSALIQRNKLSTAVYTDFLSDNGHLVARMLDGGSLLVTDNGSANTGRIFTANRGGSTLFSDAIFTGKGSFDSFLCFIGKGAATHYTTTYSDTDADAVLYDEAGLIRYNATSKVFEQSVSVSAGHRVWTTFGGSGTPPGSDTQVIFNDAGSFGAHGGLTYAKSTSALTAGGGFIGAVFSSTATGATVAVTQSSGTFSITGAGAAAFQSLSLTTRLSASYYAAPGSDTQVTFNSSGVPTGHGGLTYATSTSALTAGGGFIGAVFSSTATGSTVAVTQQSGTFSITGAGNAAFQGLTLTTRLSASYYAAPGSDTQVVFNSSGVPTGHGGLTYATSTSALTASGGFIGAVFSATATGTSSAITQQSGTFVIKGNGDASFQSVTTTNQVNAGSLEVGSSTVVNSSHQFVGGGGVLVGHLVTVACGNFYITKNSDTAYIAGVDGSFVDQGGTTQYFVGGLYVGTSPQSR